MIGGEAHMVKVKEMPDSEKYAAVVAEIELEEAITRSFVRKNLGDRAVAELDGRLDEGTKPIQDEASFEQKYETAYANWVSSGATIFAFVRERLGEDGIERYKRAAVDTLKEKNAGVGLRFLGLVRALAPSAAFSMTVKRLAYESQWLGPAVEGEYTKSRFVMDIPQCKVLDYPGSDDVCLIGCQQLNPLWMAEQFKIDQQFDRQGQSCTMTVTPLP
jgi:hypothetical protein